MIPIRSSVRSLVGVASDNPISSLRLKPPTDGLFGGPAGWAGRLRRQDGDVGLRRARDGAAIFAVAKEIDGVDVPSDVPESAFALTLSTKGPIFAGLAGK
jgi:hypothetical protein